MGKGDRRRWADVSYEEYSSNWDKIFNRNKYGSHHIEVVGQDELPPEIEEDIKRRVDEVNWSALDDL